MAKRKILDPWRQAPAEPEPPPEPKKPAYDPDAPELPQHCVQFKGKGCGINVWLEYEPTPEDVPVADALEQLCALLAYLHDMGLTPELNKLGLYRREMPKGLSVVTMGYHGPHYIVPRAGITDASMGAVTTVCAALRTLQNQDPRVGKGMKERMVRAYVT